MAASDAERRTFRVLLVSDSEAFESALRTVFTPPAFSCFLCVRSGEEAYSEAGNCDFLILDYAEQSNPARGLSAVTALSRCSAALILLFVSGASYGEWSDRASSLGITVLPRNMAVSLFRNFMPLFCAWRERLRAYEQACLVMQKRIGELQLINRTKEVLSEEYHLSEAAAHRRIEKQAMDLCMTKYDAAKLLLGHRTATLERPMNHQTKPGNTEENENE